MAFRKKPQTDPVERMKEVIAEGAKDVNKAAEKLLSNALIKPMPGTDASKSDIVLDSDMSIGRDWMAMKEDVDKMDNEFRNKYMNQVNDNFDIRVMKVERDGRLTDVSDRVRPGDVPRDRIVRFEAEPGVPIGRNADGTLNQEEALNLLHRVLGTSRKSSLLSKDEISSQRAMKAMEDALAEADITLQHWKK